MDQTQVLEVTVPAGYYAVVQPHIHFYFGDREVFPALDRAKFTIVGDSGVFLEGQFRKNEADGQSMVGLLNPDATEGMAAELRMSVDETGPQEDFMMRVKIGPFAVTRAIADAGEARAVAFGPAPDPVPVPDPVPTPDPMPTPDPVPPADPAPPTDPVPPAAA